MVWILIMQQINGQVIKKKKNKKKIKTEIYVVYNGMLATFTDNERH